MFKETTKEQIKKVIKIISVFTMRLVERLIQVEKLEQI